MSFTDEAEWLQNYSITIMGPEKCYLWLFFVMTAMPVTAIIIPGTKLKFFYSPTVSLCLNTSQKALLVIAVMD